MTRPDGGTPHEPAPTGQPTAGATDVAPGILDRFGVVRRFDEAVDEAFDQLRGNRLADRSFYTITELGDFGLVWIVLGGVRALVDVDDDGQCDPRNEFARLVVVMAAESVFVNGVVKSLVRRERPVVQEPRPHKLRIPLTTSFPSGHASSAMVAASLLGEGRRTAPLYYGLGLWVASSRIYVKIHHASDVACGLALGLALGRVARRVWPRSGRR